MLYFKNLQKKCNFEKTEIFVAKFSYIKNMFAEKYPKMIKYTFLKSL